MCAARTDRNTRKRSAVAQRTAARADCLERASLLSSRLPHRLRGPASSLGLSSVDMRELVCVKRYVRSKLDFGRRFHREVALGDAPRVLLLLDGGAKLVEIFGDGGSGLRQDVDELPGPRLVVHGEKGVRRPRLPRPPGPPDSVDVVLDGEREGVVDDAFDVGDVEPAGGDIGGDEERRAALLEGCDGGGAVALLHVAVNLGDIPTHAAERLAHARRLLFVQHKDEDAALGRRVVLLQELVERVVALARVHHLHDLRDGLARANAFGSDARDEGGGGEELGRELLNLARPRRGEHRRLAVGAYPRRDGADRGLEPEVEHPIRLVEHEKGDAVRLDLSALAKVLEPSRRRHHNRGAAVLHQRSPLHLLAVAAVHAHAPDTARPSHLGHHLRNLLRQLARRAQHQNDGRPGRQLGLILDVHQPRKRKGERLAAPGCGDSDEVAASKQDWPALCLDGRRLGVARAQLLHPGRERPVVEARKRSKPLTRRSPFERQPERLARLVRRRRGWPRLQEAPPERGARGGELGVANRRDRRRLRSRRRRRPRLLANPASSRRSRRLLGRLLGRLVLLRGRRLRLLRRRRRFLGRLLRSLLRSLPRSVLLPLLINLHRLARLGRLRLLRRRRRSRRRLQPLLLLLARLLRCIVLFDSHLRLLPLAHFLTLVGQKTAARDE
mmetsp:Transcript_1216/g.4516  ORF Transcript_1216/g.4516 Transcript_1216/m.4516 type:complete len:670 (+) Transcript_1216:981-2990(+)